MSQKSLMPVVHADDEELVCPQQALREKCGNTPHTKELYDKYQQCNDRVRSRKATEEKCEEELFDYLHALDHCVSKDLFSKLK